MQGVVTRLHTVVSRERLEAYRLQNGSDFAMVSAYVWNVRLSEALYPALQHFEIALRNRLHQSGEVVFGDPWWFDDSNAFPLARRQREALVSAKYGLSARSTTYSVGQLVAELPFGFWTGLFNSAYGASFSNAPGSQILGLTFPHAPRRHRYRETMNHRLARIRRLRNRVFHHEPIYRMTSPSMIDRYGEIIETIGWIDPSFLALTELIDRFPHVYENGLAESERDVIRFAIQFR